MTSGLKMEQDLLLQPRGHTELKTEEGNGYNKCPNLYHYHIKLFLCITYNNQKIVIPQKYARKMLWTARNGESKLNMLYNSNKLEMWANAQRDGRPAEHRWRPLFNAAKFG